MSSNINNEEHDPLVNLTIRPARSILKSTKSTDDIRSESNQEMTSYSTSGMKRSESKSYKIPRFDEMNIIATYHPIDKDYGHMKIEEPKTPYAPNDNIDEEMDTEVDNGETISSGVDPDALAQRLSQSSVPSNSSSQLHIHCSPGKSDEENTSDTEHRKQFETHRKQHYNEFEVVRLRKKEIEAELRALEQEEATAVPPGAENKETGSLTGIIKSILVHSTPSHHHYHVRVEDDSHHDVDNQSLTPEEREQRKQFELKRKKHYNEFRTTHSTSKDNQ